MNESFSDPELVELYDLINSGMEDLNFFVDQCPSEPARILDIGCGTGELAIDLVKRGHEVVAIDPEPAMITYARGKLEHERLRWVVGDLPSFRATCGLEEAGNFGLITMTGHAFQNLIIDQEIQTFFECIYELLDSDGYFLFESRNPELRSWERWDQVHDQFELPSGEPFETLTEVISFENEVLEFRETYTISQEKRIKTSTSKLRFASHSTLLSLAARANLQLLEIWGDWDGSHFNPTNSKEMIFKLGRRPS